MTDFVVIYHLKGAQVKAELVERKRLRVLSPIRTHNEFCFSQIGE